MSLSLDFEPHSWYMGFAIQRRHEAGQKYNWLAYTDNGNTYGVETVAGHTLAQLHSAIRGYHLARHNGYGERIARRHLELLRIELRAERLSYGELGILQEYADMGYIPADDIELLEAAGVPERAA